MSNPTADPHRFERIDESDPPFTLKEIKEAIGEKYFEADTSRSLYYFFQDIALILSVYFLMYLLNDYVERYAVIAYPVFWFVQGTLFWALFVVGHDCGHGSFSASQKLNYAIGHLSHTPILVPFHSWRISHHKHHLNTGSLENDESYVAVSEEHYKKMTLVGRIWRFYLYPIGGYTAYLLFGMAKEDYYSHFDPWMRMFKNSALIIESVSYVLIFLSGLMYIASIYSHLFLFKYYWMPYLVFVAWISIVTHFHHTHVDVPWYRGAEWNFLKGALSTIDRNYGIIEPIHHNIGTHIVHHLFMKIPHYKLLEATERMKPVIGKYYKKSEIGIFGNYKDAQKCKFVPDEGKKVYYTS